MPGAPLTLFEREEIGLALLDDGAVAWAVIARRIHRHPTTVSREVKVNGGRSAYRPAIAERRSERCLRRPRPARLARCGELRDRVTRELKLSVVAGRHLDGKVRRAGPSRQLGRTSAPFWSRRNGARSGLDGQERDFPPR